MVVADVVDTVRVQCEAGVITFGSGVNSLVMESLAVSAAKNPAVVTDATCPVGCVDDE
jgi:hypothetical protein